MFSFFIIILVRNFVRLGGRSSSFRRGEELWLHIDLAELRNAAAQLEECLNPFQNPHVSKSDLFDELEFRMFRQRGNGLGNSEHGAYNVV